MEVACFDPLILPCADCGLLTGQFCDGGERDLRDYTVPTISEVLGSGFVRAAILVCDASSELRARARAKSSCFAFSMANCFRFAPSPPPAAAAAAAAAVANAVTSGAVTGVGATTGATVNARAK